MSIGTPVVCEWGLKNGLMLIKLMYKRVVKTHSGALVVAQLLEQLPLTPEICGSNPVTGQLLSNICLLSTVLKRQK